MGPGVRRDDARRDAAVIIPSPSLPRGDDLDLVAVLERGLRPLGSRQHVEIQRDREMRALIFKLAQQRIDAASGDFPVLAVHDPPHCITSLSLPPPPPHPTTSP